jgi:hypothetical protein
VEVEVEVLLVDTKMVEAELVDIEKLMIQTLELLMQQVF